MMEPESPIHAGPVPQKRASVLEPLAIALVNRLGLFLLAYLGLVLIQGPHKPANAIPGNLFLDGWTRWDAWWYAQLAEHGYTNVPRDASGQRDTQQFPLYGLTVRCVSRALGNVYMSGIVVSNVCFIIACVLIFRLVERRFGAIIARRSLVLMCVWPFSYTFSAMYGESLFVMLAAGTLALGERQSWLAAAIVAAAAGATRVVGSAAAVALIVMYLQSRGFRWRDVRRRDIAALSLGFAGVVLFVLFLAIRFHDPFAFIRAQSAGGWNDFNNLDALRKTIDSWRSARFGNVASGNVPVMQSIHILAGLIALGLCAVSWRKLPAAYATFATLIVVISLYRWACIGRHAVTAFPIFIAAALALRSERLYQGIVYLSTILLAILTILFTQGFWVA
jgi:hypothetical protein